MVLSGIVDSVASFLSSLLPDVFTGLGADLYSLLPILAFGIFVYLIYKSIKIAFHGIMVFTAGALFPFFANNFFGTSIAIGFESLISYGLLALVLYLAYVFLGTFTKIVKIVTWPIRKLFSSGDSKVSKDELDEEVEEILEEEER